MNQNQNQNQNQALRQLHAQQACNPSQSHLHATVMKNMVKNQARVQALFASSSAQDVSSANRVKQIDEKLKQIDKKEGVVTYMLKDMGKSLDKIQDYVDNESSFGRTCELAFVATESKLFISWLERCIRLYQSCERCSGSKGKELHSFSEKKRDGTSVYLTRNSKPEREIQLDLEKQKIFWKQSSGKKKSFAKIKSVSKSNLMS